MPNHMIYSDSKIKIKIQKSYYVLLKQKKTENVSIFFLINFITI